MSSSAPKYDEQASWDAEVKAAQAQAKYGTYGVNSILGSLSTVQNPDGTTSLVYGQSAADTQRQNLISQGLGSLSLDGKQAQQAYYNQATRQLLPQFEKDQNRLHEQLINRGITEGSNLYNDQMGNLRNSQIGQLADIANQAVYEGQNYVGNRINNIGALAGQYDILNVPGLSGSTGATFSNTYDKKFQQDLEDYNRKMQARTGMLKTVGQGVGAAIGAIYGGHAGAAVGGKAGGDTGEASGQAMQGWS